MGWEIIESPLLLFAEKNLDVEVRRIGNKWSISLPKDSECRHEINWKKKFDDVLSIIREKFGVEIAEDLNQIYVANNIADKLKMNKIE